MKILVTGGAGFIGSHVCESLVSRGDNILCLDNLNDYYDPKIKQSNIKRLIGSKNFTFIKGDITDIELMKNVFEKGEFDKVIHLAACAGVRPSIANPLLYENVNIKGTLNILELCKKFGIKKLVFASSSSVYGDSKKLPLSEKDNVNFPISPYAATKKAGEELCYTYHHLYDIPVVCLRFFTVYGPRGRPDMAIYKFTNSISEGKTIELYGDGSSSRDYTYVEDIVSGVISALDRDLNYEIINLGDSRTIQLMDLVKLIEKNVGKKAKVKFLPTQPGDVFVTYADISKAKKILGYEPKTKIEDGIRKYVAWYQQNTQ